MGGQDVTDRRDHDVIVIGSGLGGLTAAAKLARAGQDVRLLERHVQPGGYATTFFRPPFEFEVSLHELSGIGTPDAPGPLWEDLDDLGVASRLEFLPVTDLYRTVAPEHDLDLRVPAHPEGARAALVDAFPHERRGLNRVYDRFFEIQREIRALSEAGDLSIPDTIRRFPAVSHAAGVPLSALLYNDVRDPAARLAVGQIWSYFGLPPEQLSAVLYAGGLTAYLIHGASHIKGKSQALSNALARAIEEAGGQVSLGNGARRILCEGGRVTGVITDEGERLTAPTVVANANPITVALDLVGEEHLPPSFVDRLGQAEPSTGTVCVYLGLSAENRELGMVDHEVFINATLDMEAQYRALQGLEPPDSFLVTAYNATDPDFSPPGTSVVVLVTLCDGRPWMALPPEQYPELKQRWAEHLVGRADQFYPGLAAAVEVAVVSTPLTNMRYTGNPAGAVYGFANTPSQNPAFRMEQRGPLDGLWFAGAWTRPGGGFEPSINSGLNAAAAILAEVKARAPAVA